MAGNIVLMLVIAYAILSFFEASIRAGQKSMNFIMALICWGLIKLSNFLMNKIKSNHRKHFFKGMFFLLKKVMENDIIIYNRMWYK